MSEITPYSHDVKLVSNPTEAEPAHVPTPVDVPRMNTREQYAGLNAEAQERLRAAQEHAANILRTADADAADVLRTTAIEGRALGKEGEHSDVSLLNDRAELLIYGSKGRTYHDPETNQVVADKEHVIPSVFDRIRDDKRWGQTEAEREDVAKGFERELNVLLEDGFELTQAKIIMDHRMGDYLNVKETTEKLEKTAPTRVRKLLSGGVPVKDEAGRQAKLAEAKQHIAAENKRQTARMHKTADKSDAELLQLIREKGIFSDEDLARVQAGEELYDGARYKTTEKAPTPPTPPTLEEKAEKERQDRIKSTLDHARDRYAKAEAARSRRALTLGGTHTREGVDEVYAAYRQALSESLVNEFELMEAAGLNLTEDQVKEQLLLTIASDGEKVAVLRERQQQVDLGTHDKEGTRKDLNLPQRTLQKLRTLWYNTNPEKYREEIEKEIAKARVDAGQELDGKLAATMMDRIIHDQVEGQTEHEVRNNRIRRGSMLGVAALTSTVAGNLFADTISHGFHGIFGGGGNKQHTADLANPHHGHYQPKEKHELGYPKHGHYQPETGGGTNGVSPEHVNLGNAEFPSQYFDQHDLNLDATVRKAQENGLGINRVGLPGGRYFLELVKPNGDKITDSTQRVVDALQPYAVKK
jgi:hypothetical protein